jgi:hypothetical protein
VTYLTLACTATATAQPLEVALARAFDENGEGLRLLREAGAEYRRVLTLERLPSGNYLAEVQIDVDERPVRYPLKLTRTSSGWSIVWQPTGAYAAGLASMVKSGSLPDARGATVWTNLQRLPALPIIGTRSRIISPFGEVDPADAAEGKSQGDLDLSPQLVRHVQRWVNVVLDQDPAPAGFDLILDRQTDWRFANKLLFNASVVGLYQIALVVNGEDELSVVELSSPVSTRSGEAAPTVVAVYGLDGERFGLRISVDGELVERKGACAVGMTLCIAEASELPDALERVIQPGGHRAMFAAQGDVRVGDAVALVAAFVDFMGLPDYHVLMGYVQK